MRTYEYKSIQIKGKFRSEDDVIKMDRLINDSAEHNWELVSTTSLANSIWGSPGRTSGMLLTFRRDRDLR